ncbi:MAG: 50S ribosomal protein L17 [Sandaracinus sp.]
MHHHKSGRKFGRNTPHRRAMFRNLAANLVLHERVETTDAKAKEIRRIVERLITRATRLGDDLTADIGKLKEGEGEKVLARRVHAQRLVASFLPRTGTKTNADGTTEEVDLVHKLFHDIAPRFMARVKENKGGGYTRVIKLNPRRGDNSPMAIVEILPAAES